MEIPESFIKRMKTLKTAQSVILAFWAGLNVLVSSVFLFQTEAYQFYFFMMNISWNVVNACVAAFLYAHHNDVFDRPISILHQLEYQRHIEKAMVFNLGLDMTYISTGFAMYYYGNIPQVFHNELWLGFGISLILKGSYLIIQDMVFYRLHRKNHIRAYPYWENLLLG